MANHRRYRYLSHRWASRIQVSLCVCTDSSEPSLLTYIKYGCRWKLRPNFKTRALLGMAVLTFICGICAFLFILFAYAISTEISCAGPNSIFMFSIILLIVVLSPLLKSHSTINIPFFVCKILFIYLLSYFTDFFTNCAYLPCDCFDWMYMYVSCILLFGPEIWVFMFIYYILDIAVSHWLCGNPQLSWESTGKRLIDPC